MQNMLTVMGITIAAMSVWMLLLWLLSVARHDASIVDIFWGLSFILIGAIGCGVGHGFPARKALIGTLTAIWGLRLAIHIFVRNRGKGEDFRYRAMRKRYGARFPIASLFVVFGLQGLLAWIISAPLQAATSSPEPSHLTALDFVGAAIWAVGFLFESVGDWQLARFKSNPSNKGKVMDQGLWKYTRHPNYFGDALLWWGFFLIAACTAGTAGLFTAVGPALMTFLLMKISGAALLEKTLVKTKPEYRDYIARTGAFFPWPPKRAL